MGKREDLFFDSRDGRTKIHGVIWKPDCMLQEPPQKPKCILQIVHGMEEYITRYDEFARFMNEHDVCVIGEDHLGHGQSISDDVPLGYFCKKDAATVVVRDVHRLKKLVQKDYPGVPIVIMGHSMGSFITRNYISRYGSGISGAIIMGTGSQPAAVLGAGKFLSAVFALFHGWKAKSPFMKKTAFGAYLARIPDAEAEYDWLSVNTENVRKYLADPLCGFGFTLNGYNTMFHLISRCQSKKYVSTVPKNMPLLFVAGAQDPVGSYGEGVKKAVSSYQKAGIRNIQLKLYEEGRHEILNDDIRETVSEDIWKWLEGIVKEYDKKK